LPLVEGMDCGLNLVFGLQVFVAFSDEAEPV